MSDPQNGDAELGGETPRREWLCPHCDYVAESIKDRNDHISSHRVVRDNSGDGPPDRVIV